MEKLWGGRFQKHTSGLMEDFHSSITFDQKLYHYDIQGSMAHATMLGECEIITREEAQQIVEGLAEIEQDILEDKVVFSTRHEDIHMNMEVLLTEKIGEVAKKLHTARSRNDQVALDLKLYSRDMTEYLSVLLKKWIQVLLDLAEKNTETIIPGYTHLQRAQPITLGHHIMAYVEMARRDLARLGAWQKIHNTMPLGSGALAGTTFPIDREFVADLLEFDSPCLNSLDGVSDRDFAIDLLSACATGMMHLSRFCEEIILWSSQEYHFIELDDGYSTGSSMMPQKKNPDAAELIRGKSARVFGDLSTILTVMKGLPLAYNKDMQEDKECLFDGVETWIKCLTIMTPMVETMKICSENMEAAANIGFTNATDLADYLVKKGIPFRDAHRITGEIVFMCIEKGVILEEICMEEYRSYCDKIDEDIYEAIEVLNCVEQRKSIGGPSPERVKEHIEIVRKELEEN